MEREQINLTNAKLRICMKRGDVIGYDRAKLELTQNDQLKSKQLDTWFEEVHQNFKNKEKLNISMMSLRMWQLGSLDIQGICSTGVPVFMLTNTALEKIKDTPLQKLHEVLLWPNQKQVV